MGNKVTPDDRFMFVGIIFFVLGLGTLLPWNFFITAIPFFENRLNETHRLSGNGSESGREEWHFGNWLSLLAMLPLLLFSCLNSILYTRVPERVRIAGSLFLIFSLFLVTVILVKFRLSPSVFFAVVMVIIWFINSSSAVLQGSLFGLVGQLPARYSSLFMSGQGVAGIFAALASIIARASDLDEETTALGYFVTPCLVILITIVLYSLLSRLEFAQFHFKNNFLSDYQLNPEHEKTMMVNGTGPKVSIEPPESERETANVIKVFKKIWVMALSVCLIFTVTLSVFPAVTSAVSEGNWGGYFTTVCCFLLFNVMDWGGRSATAYVMWPKKDSPVLPALVLLRVAFIPLFMLCDVKPRSYLPVVFGSDVWYIGFMILFALSNGYLVTLCMCYAPKKVSPKNSETAGAVMAFFLSLGLALGAALSFFIRVLI
uniref:Solute carrier family 29 (Nucleoside transporters), member 2 n=1 Tax=Callorhinchus milii TaxID=7868 RepID=V9KTY5_CALMI